MVTVTVPVYNEENKVYQVLSFLGNNEVHNVKPKTLIDVAYVMFKDMNRSDVSSAALLVL